MTAQEMDANLSPAAEDGIRRSTATAADARWAAQYREKIEAWNHFLEEHGSPLDAFYTF